MAKTKFIRVAIAGFTASDGRTIEAHWLKEAAANYNPATFTARVNVEHIRNLSADGPFPALGDVLALRTQDDEIEIAGKTEKRVALYAQIEGNEILQAYVGRDQKKFSSIEIEPNFSGSGKAYLIGLAATDNPASLGVEALRFSAGQEAYAKELKAALDSRKQHASSLFSAAIETAFEYEAPQTPNAGDPAGFLDKLFSGLDARLNPKREAPKPEHKAPGDAASDPAAVFAALFKDFGAELQTGLKDAFAADRQTTRQEIARVTSEFAALRSDIEKTAQPPGQYAARPAATGGDGVQLTDC